MLIVAKTVESVGKTTPATDNPPTQKKESDTMSPDERVLSIAGEYGFGKFERNADQLAYSITLDSVGAGHSDGEGTWVDYIERIDFDWLMQANRECDYPLTRKQVALVAEAVRYAIVGGDDRGFVTVTWYKDHDEYQRDRATIDRAWAEFYATQDDPENEI